MSTEKKCQTFAKGDRVRILLSDRSLNNAGLNRADVDGVYVVDCQQPDFLGKQTYSISREVRCPNKSHQIFYVTCCQIEKVPAAEQSFALSRQPQPSPTLCNECDKSPIPANAGDDEEDFDDGYRGFEVGHLVRLASGGPEMTITEMSTDYRTVKCVWFTDTDEELRTFSFRADCLRSSDDDSQPPLTGNSTSVF